MTDIEKIRLKINDKTEPYHFTDIELQSFLTDEGSVGLASATALEAWAVAYAPNANSESIGGYSYSQKIVDQMLALAKRLREKESGIPAMTWAELDLLGTDEGDV